MDHLEHRPVRHIRHRTHCVQLCSEDKERVGIQKRIEGFIYVPWRGFGTLSVSATFSPPDTFVPSAVCSLQLVRAMDYYCVSVCKLLRHLTIAYDARVTYVRTAKARALQCRA
jgi:hypothetical protein